MRETTPIEPFTHRPSASLRSIITCAPTFRRSSSSAG